MTAKQYRAAIKRLGLSQRAAAKLLGVDERTSRRYAGRGAPKIVKNFLEFVDAYMSFRVEMSKPEANSHKRIAQTP